MVTFEEVCKKIFSDPKALTKLLIGILIMFIPIVNLAALGYLRIYLQQIRACGDFSLPEWKISPVKLFMEGVYLFVVMLVFALVPILIAALAVMLVNLLSLGVLGRLTYVLFSPVLLLIPSLVAAANYRLGPDSNWRSLTDIKVILGMVAATWRTLLMPSFALWGLLLLFLPVYGLSSFIGMIVFFAYATLVFVYLEKRGTDLV